MVKKKIVKVKSYTRKTKKGKKIKVKSHKKKISVEKKKMIDELRSNFLKYYYYDLVQRYIGTYQDIRIIQLLPEWKKVIEETVNLDEQEKIIKKSYKYENDEVLKCLVEKTEFYIQTMNYFKKKTIISFSKISGKSSDIKIFNEKFYKIEEKLEEMFLDEETKSELDVLAKKEAYEASIECFKKNKVLIKTELFKYVDKKYF